MCYKIQEDIIRDKIYTAIRAAGYKYAKYYYENWCEVFKDELNDKESYYFGSINSNGNPLREIFEEQIYEQAYHNYCSGTNDDFFVNFYIDGFSKEERDIVDDEYLFEHLQNGFEDFVKETYQN